jgi:TPR repeat protein
MIGRCHELGHGTAVNSELAAAWYRRAAQNGSSWGMYNYANLLATGRGVRADQAAAFAWYLRAAKQGHAKSMNLTGRCYEEGLGVEIDIATAHRWYQESAEAGDFRGQRSHAAVLLEAGQNDEAAYWLRRAIETKAAANR